MKDRSDSQAWVPIVAGIAGLLAVGIAFRQCGSSPSAELVSEPKLAAKPRLGDNQRGGWNAQSQPRTSGAVAERGRPGTAVGRMANGAPPSRIDRDSDAGDFAPPRRGGGSRDAGERDFHDTDTVDVAGDNIAAQPHLPPANAANAAGAVGAAGTSEGGEPAANTGAKPAAAPRQAAKSSAGTSDSSQTQPAVEAKGPAQAEEADNNGPVLSLPLDNSLDPDKGDTTPIIANGVTFDANGAHFAADAQMFIPSSGTVNAAAGTFTFWMLPDWGGDIDSQFQILHLGANTFENHLDIFKDFRYLRLLFTPNSGLESGAGRDVADWKPGDRHMITATWGDGVCAMYIDAVSVGAKEYDGELDIGPDPPLFIGSGNPKVKAGANSNIRNFQIYTRSLSPDEIAELFAQPPS